jgi:hypothetical protein
LFFSTLSENDLDVIANIDFQDFKAIEKNLFLMDLPLCYALPKKEKAERTETGALRSALIFMILSRAELSRAEQSDKLLDSFISYF